MNLIPEELARAQSLERLEQARNQRRGHELARSKRLARKAEKAAYEARLHLARAL